MKTKRRFSRSLRTGCLSLFFFLCVLQTAAAAVVRGRLDRVDRSGQRAGAGGVPVTILTPGSGRSPAAYSAQDGMYYIYNVPAGNYVLEVWVNGPNARPMTYPISVGEPYRDVPPITVP